MPQHGFARRSTFTLIEREEASARLRLSGTDATRECYPFRFELDVAGASSLTR
jgi:galactose mutarotase-like enzyme